MKPRWLAQAILAQVFCSDPAFRGGLPLLVSAVTALGSLERFLDKAPGFLNPKLLVPRHCSCYQPSDLVHPVNGERQG